MHKILRQWILAQRAGLAESLSFILLLLLGVYKLFEGVVQALIRKHASFQREIHFSLLRLRCILRIYADPARADAWKAEPYLTTIRQWARTAEREGGMVMVWCGPRVTIVTPTRDIALGEVREDQLIVPVERMTPRGVERTFEVRDAV